MLTGRTGLPPNRPISKNWDNFGNLQPIWLKLGVESLNGRTQHTWMIYKDLSMLTGRNGLPPNQPTLKNWDNFGNFQSIWIKLGVESLNGRTQHMWMIYEDLSMLTSQTGLPPNQPILKKWDNFGNFQPIWLKLGVESLNGRTQHMWLIYKDLSMLTGLPPNQQIGQYWKKGITLAIFNRFG